MFIARRSNIRSNIRPRILVGLAILPLLLIIRSHIKLAHSSSNDGQLQFGMWAPYWSLSSFNGSNGNGGHLYVNATTIVEFYNSTNSTTTSSTTVAINKPKRHNNTTSIILKIGEEDKLDQICDEYSAETLRAHSVHWRVEAADATVTLFPLSRTDKLRKRGTLGVQIAMNNNMDTHNYGGAVKNESSSSFFSQQHMQKYVGRSALRREQTRLAAAKNAKFLPNILTRADDKQAPKYDQYLGCPKTTTTDASGRHEGQQQRPNGTAIVVVQNFYCANIWHALANIHGIWLLMEIAQVDPSQVTAILPGEYGSPFKSPARYIADVLWPLFTATRAGDGSSNNHNNNSSSHHYHEAQHRERGRAENAVQTNCFERILFMETPSYRPGPYWGYNLLLSKGVSCSEDSPYMKMQSRFHHVVRQTAFQLLGLDDTIRTSANSAKPTVCYMSRRLREGRRRYFSESLAPTVEKAIDSWANKNKQSNKISYFHHLEFDEDVPIAKQVEQVSQCSILFGQHGAGLAHQVWMARGGQIIEIGTSENGKEVESCLGGYFGSMAYWYGHSYTCLTELEGHGIVLGKSGIYQSLNVTLLLNVLDGAVEVHGTI